MAGPAWLARAVARAPSPPRAVHARSGAPSPGVLPALALAGLAAACAPSGGRSAKPAGPGVDTAADTATASPDPTHLLVTTLGGFANEPLRTGAIELDLDLQPTWRAEIEAPTGALGAARLPDGDTLVMATQAPPGIFAEILRVDAAGARVSSFATADGQSFGFPHGIGRTVDGVVVVGDSFRGRVVAVDEETGAHAWTVEASLIESGSISGAYLGPVEADGSHRLGVTFVGNINGGSTQHSVHMYRIPPGGGAPTEEWVWPPAADMSTCLWPHGVTFDADGSVVVGLGGLGQLIRLDAAGAPLKRYPPDDAPWRLNFPRHTAFLPDGRWVVSDAAMELVVIDDPEGAFTVSSAQAMQAVYDVHLIDCATQACYGSAAAPVGF